MLQIFFVYSTSWTFCVINQIISNRNSNAKFFYSFDVTSSHQFIEKCKTSIECSDKLWRFIRTTTVPRPTQGKNIESIICNDSGRIILRLAKRRLRRYFEIIVGSLMKYHIECKVGFSFSFHFLAQWCMCIVHSSSIVG